jgi:hypothetical protein
MRSSAWNGFLRRGAAAKLGWVFSILPSTPSLPAFGIQKLDAHTHTHMHAHAHAHTHTHTHTPTHTYVYTHTTGLAFGIQKLVKFFKEFFGTFPVFNLTFPQSI